MATKPFEIEVRAWVFWPAIWLLRLLCRSLHLLSDDKAATLMWQFVWFKAGKQGWQHAGRRKTDG